MNPKKKTSRRGAASREEAPERKTQLEHLLQHLVLELHRLQSVVTLSLDPSHEPK